jgi:hypothetical protein
MAEMPVFTSTSVFLNLGQPTKGAANLQGTGWLESDAADQKPADHFWAMPSDDDPYLRNRERMTGLGHLYGGGDLSP